MKAVLGFPSGKNGKVSCPEGDDAETIGGFCEDEDKKYNVFSCLLPKGISQDCGNLNG